MRRAINLALFGLTVLGVVCGSVLLNAEVASEPPFEWRHALLMLGITVCSASALSLGRDALQ